MRRGRILVHGGWARGGHMVRRGMTFRFVPRAHGARLVVPTRRGDRLVYTALTAGRPEPTARGVRAAAAGTRASAPARVAVAGPLAASSSLDVWRADLDVRAPGKRLRSTIRAR